MPKIFKVSGYFIDPNDIMTANSLEVEMSEGFDMIAHHILVKEVELGEWDDSNPLNRCDCTIEECEKYFHTKEETQ